jgi:hypothetical protein
MKKAVLIVLSPSWLKDSQPLCCWPAELQNASKASTFRLASLMQRKGRRVAMASK